MSSELAKGLLVGSCVIVIVSAGFMTFSTPTSVGAADLDVYVKCQACGEVKFCRSEDFAELAQKQLNELKSSDPDLVDEIMYDLVTVIRRPMMPPPSDAQIERRIIALWGSKDMDIPVKCEKCGEYECFKAFKCKKCNEIFVIETPQDRSTKTCSQCRG